MDPTERKFKLATTFLLTGFVSRGTRWPLWKAVVAGHFANFLLNGHLWGLVKKFDLIRTSPTKFEKWTAYLEKVGRLDPSIAAILIYGSHSYDGQTEYSDLDARVIRYPGIRNGIQSCFVIGICRLVALLGIFPIDIYVFDGSRSLDRLDSSENPTVLVDKEDWF